jgi:glucokinase
MHTYNDGPRLLADIGGTNARFALETGPGTIQAPMTLACADYPRFQDALHAYLAISLANYGEQVAHAVIAIANPVDGDAIRMTNHHWAFSIEAARAELQLTTLLMVNDFTALAMALPSLGPADLMQVGGGVARPGGAIGLVGAGTGLGVSGLVAVDGRWTALHSEGGHVAFSPSDEREVAVLRYGWQRYEHVSAERFVSGPGIALIREAIAASRGAQVDLSLSPADIVARALDGSDPLCREAIDCFCGMLGTVAANLAVTLGAHGGMYIGGGVVPRLGDYFAASPFRARFENKGRFSAFTAGIPTWVITAPEPALAGASNMLAAHLARAGHTAAPRRMRGRVAQPRPQVIEAAGHAR